MPSVQKRSLTATGTPPSGALRSTSGGVASPETQRERVELVGQRALAVGAPQLAGVDRAGAHALGGLGGGELEQLAHARRGARARDAEAVRRRVGGGGERHLARQRGARLVGAQGVLDRRRRARSAGRRRGRRARRSSRCGRGRPRAPRPSLSSSSSVSSRRARRATCRTWSRLSMRPRSLGVSAPGSASGGGRARAGPRRAGPGARRSGTGASSHCSSRIERQPPAAIASTHRKPRKAGSLTSMNSFGPGWLRIR